MMADLARNLTNEELQQAAEYFSSMKFPRWIEVVESSTVPKTRISGGMFIPTSAGREPIGARIIEVPKDPEAVEVLRNPRVGFIAYVPPGSLAKGEALVKTAGGKMPLPCITCHGSDLRGMLNIPAIAGRSPSYMARQMFDMKSGARAGTGVDLMKPIVANLNAEDILAIVAYVASLNP
jgi:cytochrome c553